MIMTEKEYLEQYQFLLRQMHDTERERDKKMHEMRVEKAQVIGELNRAKARLTPHWWNRKKINEQIVDVENERMEKKCFYDYRLQEIWHHYEDRLTTLRENIHNVKYERQYESKRRAEERKEIEAGDVYITPPFATTEQENV